MITFAVIIKNKIKSNAKKRKKSRENVLYRFFLWYNIMLNGMVK
jgi:hypothetical protein